jgi:hypothetical protein
MLSTIALVLLLLWLAFMAFIWFRGGLSKGRMIGNKVAAHIGIEKNLFHTILDNGVTGPSLRMLSTLDNSYLSIDQISVMLAPSLTRGILALEQRFGHQPQLEQAKPIVSVLQARWEIECN